ncbi:MAG: elongation factor P--(R)-beta-lysine ligase [Candidatus Lightella neohaematopini]|nr:elongation factor P--(R)-beta-lysine ligase [Candidatus Lightella neohaematopini]
MNNMWQPNISVKNLIKRAKLIRKIRKFFEYRNYVEVETPSLSNGTITNVNIIPFETKLINNNYKKLYLISSPEFHMKRLLCVGMNKIFQLCHSFRNGEIGKYHNPEFTILEWYRKNCNMNSIMLETDTLLKLILKYKKSEFISYQNIFIKHTNIDPLNLDKEKINKFLLKNKLTHLFDNNYNNVIQLIFSLVIIPKLGLESPVFVYHFPTYQAELACINNKNNEIADRFEVYFKGIELSNGCYELINAKEQLKRFMYEFKKVISNKLKRYIDKKLVLALKYGNISNYSGVALGVDRLIMLALKINSLKEVISFDIRNA